MTSSAEIERDAALTVCTIVSKNYLAQARVLAESLARQQPDARLYVLVTDRVDGRFDPAGEPFTVVQLEELGIPNLPGFCFKYSILELNTAVKPYLLEHLFAARGARKLVYLDPDIMVLGSLAPLGELLDRHVIVLTPHLTTPVADGKRPREVDILRSGAFNLGFLALGDRPAARQMLAWWQQRLYAGCRVDPDNGYFVDQKWMDLVPGLFDDVFVLRDPGYNVAYWNLHGRSVTLRGEEVRVNGVPCRFFHFSGYDPANPEVVSIHQDRLTMQDLGDGADLFRSYARRLKEKGHREISRWPYSWAAFDNGEAISPAARLAYLELGEGAARFGDPFATAGEGSFHAHLRAASSNGHVVTTGGALPFGVNLAGYFQAETGVGEGCRLIARALQAAGVPHVLNNVVDGRSANREGAGLTFTSENPFAINLVHVNADAVPGFVQSHDPAYLAGRKNVGFWNWELSTFPAMWSDSFAPFDEVWTPSTSTRRSVAGAAPIPVHCIPYPVEIPASDGPGLTRAALGLPEDAFLFVFAFDFHSFVERKNPFGTIRAFQRAFGKDAPVGLVVKTVHAESDAAGWQALQAACAGWPNIHLLDRLLDRRGMHDLVRVCDTFVSLHRAEGFGFLMAEAMAMGKPTLATAYSSNLDFMNPENSLLVRCREIPIERDRGPYQKGALWAEPDVEHAAELMAAVMADRERAARLGERARADIALEHAPARIGALIRSRLMELYAEPVRAGHPASLAAQLSHLRRSADLMSADGVSSRPVVGRAVERVRKMAVQLLRPSLARQSVHNQVMLKALAQLDERLQEHERALARLRSKDQRSKDQDPS